MPTYTIRNKITGETEEKFMSISEMLDFEKANTDVEVMCGTPLIHTGGGLGLRSMRTDENFRSRLKQIAKKFPGNNLGKTESKF